MEGKRNKRSVFSAVVVAVIALFLCFAAVACSDNIPLNGATDNKFTGFTRKPATNVLVYDNLNFEDFIVYVNDEYTITLYKDGEEIMDITDVSSYFVMEPGEYSIKYVIHTGRNKGTYVHNFTVGVPYINWRHKEGPMTFAYQETIQFEDVFNDLEISVESYYDWIVYMVDVRVDGVTTPLGKDVTSYTINSRSQHTFRYRLETEDGQTRQMLLNVLVTG